MRNMSNESHATYKNFRLWLSDTTPTEDMWHSIMAEDETYDYSSQPSLQHETLAIEKEVDVYTSSGHNEELPRDSYGSGEGSEDD